MIFAFSKAVLSALFVFVKLFSQQNKKRQPPCSSVIKFTEPTYWLTGALIFGALL
jgi:hypothetical protein